MTIDLLRDGLVRVQRERTDDDEGQPAAVPQDPDPADAGLETCALCGQRASDGRCVQCRRPTCQEDRWVMYGLCRDCLTEDELDHARAPKETVRPDLGIKWVED